MRLVCKQCGGEARIDGAAVVRDCGHNTSGVTAELSATVYGVGNAASRIEDGRLTFMRRIIAKLVNKIRGRA